MGPLCNIDNYKWRISNSYSYSIVIKFFYPFVYTISTDCNVSFFADLLEANHLPVCYQEVEGTIRYMASLVDDAEPDAMSFDDHQKWFRVMAGNKYTSGKTNEPFFSLPKWFVLFDDFVLRQKV